MSPSTIPDPCVPIAFQADRSAGRKRRQLMLDQGVQGALIRQVVATWILCLMSTVLAAWVWGVACRPNPASLWRTFVDLTPALLGSLIVLPLAVADMLRISHRFVGPVLRLKNAMKRISLGDDIDPLRFRPGDKWAELGEEFERLQSKIKGDAP